MSDQQVDAYRAYRELERWLFYTPQLGALPSNWEESAELIMTIIYDPEKQEVRYERPASETSTGE